MRVMDRVLGRIVGARVIGRRWGSALRRPLRVLRLDALQPLLEATERLALLAQLRLGLSSPLLELEQVLCLVPVDLEFQRRDATLPLGDLREQPLATALQLRRLVLQ